MKIAILSKNSVFNNLSITKSFYKHIDFFKYDTIFSINYNSYYKYDYIIILNICCYIDEDRLIKFLENKDLFIGSLSSYWGYGSFYINIINVKHLNKYDLSLYSKYNKIFNLEEEDFICKLFLNTINIQQPYSIESMSHFLETLNTKKLKQICNDNNIIPINSYIYSDHIDSCSGQYHNSIFVHYTGGGRDLKSYILEYRSKKKIIGFNNIRYIAILGLNFFVYKKQHIVILSPTIFLIWKSSRWIQIKSKKKILAIKNYVYKYAKSSFVSLRLDS